MVPGGGSVIIDIIVSLQKHYKYIHTFEDHTKAAGVGWKLTDHRNVTVSKVYDFIVFMNVTTYLHTKNSVDKTRVNSGITRWLLVEYERVEFAIFLLE